MSYSDSFYYNKILSKGRSKHENNKTLDWKLSEEKGLEFANVEDIVLLSDGNFGYFFDYGIARRSDSMQMGSMHSVSNDGSYDSVHSGIARRSDSMQMGSMHHVSTDAKYDTDYCENARMNNGMQTGSMHSVSNDGSYDSVHSGIARRSDSM